MMLQPIDLGSKQLMMESSRLSVKTHRSQHQMIKLLRHRMTIRRRLRLKSFRVMVMLQVNALNLLSMRLLTSHQQLQANMSIMCNSLSMKIMLSGSLLPTLKVAQVKLFSMWKSIQSQKSKSPKRQRRTI